MDQMDEMIANWQIDVRVSQHVTGELAFLVLPFDVEFHIGLPDGRQVCVTKAGNVVLDGGLKLYNVLYVPHLACNLISVSRLVDDYRCLFHFNQSYCYIWDEDTGVVIAQGIRRGGLYYYSGMPRKSSPLTDFDSWHRPSERISSMLPVLHNNWVLRRDHECKIIKTMDVISNLPIDLLVFLLSFVDMKTAGRTSVLSKRWRYIWTYRTSLDFEDPEFVTQTDFKKVNPETMSRFCNWVNQVITSHQATYLDFMRIHFPLDGYYYVYNIDKWVEFALRKKVAILELNFSFGSGYCREDPCSRLGFMNPTRTFRHYVTILKSPHLKSLNLENASIYGPLIEVVLSNCINLEHLSLKACYINGLYPDSCYPENKMVVSSLKLKCLKICHCQYITSLKLCTPELTSLVLIVWNKIEVEYIDVSSLVDVTFMTSYCYSVYHNFHLFPDFSFNRLKKLSLYWHHMVNYVDPGIPSLRFDNLIVLISLIVACRSLHTFKLELCFIEEDQSSTTSTDMKNAEMDYTTSIQAHQHLKVLEMVGYDGSASLEKLALCLTHAPMLDKIIFDPHHPKLTIGNLHKVFDIENKKKISLARTRAKLLAKRIRDDILVLIL